MESLFILIPLSVLAVGVAVGVFFWMNHDGQFDDDQGPAWSILLDDDRPETDASARHSDASGGSCAAVTAEQSGEGRAVRNAGDAEADRGARPKNMPEA